MDLKEYIKKAKKILKEDAGSEGLCYKVYYTGNLEAEDLIVETTKIEDGIKCSVIKFNYPKDYGFALNYLKDINIDVIKLELLF